jgi:hypothetical protein
MCLNINEKCILLAPIRRRNSPGVLVKRGRDAARDTQRPKNTPAETVEGTGFEMVIRTYLKIVSRRSASRRGLRGQSVGNNNMFSPTASYPLILT